jgi:uncharacterized membrane protein YfhO
VTGTVAGRVEVVRYEPEEVELSAELPGPRVVVLNDLYAPGWTARLDGADVTIHRANSLVRGVLVGAGRHQLVFHFEAPNLQLGLALSALMLVACLALMLRELRRDSEAPRG